MSHLPVVVAYNGRSHAQEALVWAAGEATRRGAQLTVLYAANYPGMAVPPGPGLLELEPGALEASREVTMRGVSQVATTFPDLAVTGRTEVTGPARALLEISPQSSLIVMGSRARGPVLGGLLGSVAFTVAGSTQCPLVVVKEGAGSTVAGPHHDVIVGTDGSAAAASAVEFAADHALSCSATLQVICCTGDDSEPHAVPQGSREAAEAVLELSRASLENTHPRLSVTTRLGDGVPDEILVDASAGAGLLVVGSRGRGAFKSMVAGSTACAVIRGGACPVAVIGDGVT